MANYNPRDGVPNDKAIVKLLTIQQKETSQYQKKSSKAAQLKEDPENPRAHLFDKYFDAGRMSEVTMECYSNSLYVKVQKMSHPPELDKPRATVQLKPIDSQTIHNIARFKSTSLTKQQDELEKYFTQVNEVGSKLNSVFINNKKNVDKILQAC